MIGPLFSFSRGTLMLDVMPVAMVLIVPILSFSLWQVRVKHDYRLHGRIQSALAALLLVAIILFELDIRLNGWRQLAEPSPFYTTWLFPMLYFHLCFAVSCTGFWLYMVASVLRRRPVPGGRDAASLRHMRMGGITAALTYTTAVTGCTFYWMAFVAA